MADAGAAVQAAGRSVCSRAMSDLQIQSWNDLLCSKMTQDEVGASSAALAHGVADDAAIMQFIAAFMCSGSKADGFQCGDPAALPASRQHSSNGITSSADGQHEVDVVANVLHRLSAHDSSLRPAEANGSRSRTAADAIASGQFDWAGGLPQADSHPQQDSTNSGVTERQEASEEQQRLPAGGSAEAAQAMLSGQFQWGGGGSTPQPLAALPPEAVIS